MDLASATALARAGSTAKTVVGAWVDCCQRLRPRSRPSMHPPTCTHPGLHTSTQPDAHTMPARTRRARTVDLVLVHDLRRKVDCSSPFMALSICLGRDRRQRGQGTGRLRRHFALQLLLLIGWLSAGVAEGMSFALSADAHSPGLLTACKGSRSTVARFRGRDGTRARHE